MQVNGKKVNIPSYQVKVGDVIEIRDKAKKMEILETSKQFASGLQSPMWLQIDRDAFSGKVVALPKREEIQLPVNEQLIVELYSK